MEDFSERVNAFGTIIVDECHHIPAKTFRETIVKFNAYYLYGLTATPKRKNNDEKLIYVYVGEVLSEIRSDFSALKQATEKNISVHIKETKLFVPFDYRIDQYETISKILIYDCTRNQMIAEDITGQVNERKRVLVLTERKEHVHVLNLYLKDKLETITLTGEDSDSARKSKLEQITLGHFQVVIATGQLFGEGTDMDTLECLFLVYPFAFEGKLIQYIGRIQRSEKPPVIFDYRDIKMDYFEKLFKKRNRYYKKILGKSRDH
jgi:superfamily II DNA or RNA helicase